MVLRSRRRKPSVKKLLWWLLGIFVAIQFVPYGRDHANPPIGSEPRWDSTTTRELARAACFDCHSNETRWPAYASVAPSSWLVQNDVDGARRHLNFSEWQQPQRHAKDAADEVRTRDMPPAYYALMHPAAKLNDADRERLTQGLERMFGSTAAAH